MRLKMYIDGEWAESEGGEYTPLRSPATGEVLAEVPRGTREDVKRAVEVANKAKGRIADMPIFERARLCHAIADRLEGKGEELAKELSLEHGKPLREARGEVETAVEMWRAAAEDIKRLEGEVLPSSDPNKRIMTIRQPRGVYGVITPWNFPLTIPTEYLAAGLATGNAVVWKPASYTPIIAVRMVECCEEAGVPKGVLNLVIGPGSTVGDEIASNPHIQGIGLTGSTETGMEVADKAPGKSLLLELGGNGPVIVCEDAYLPAAIKRAAYGCYANAGQICDSTERILVHEKVHDEFVAGIIEETEAVRLGHPLHEETTMGPLNNEPTAAKVDRHLEDALAKGAKILFGGKRASGFPTDLYYEPTVIDGVTRDMLLNQEETFGPVAPILTFSHDEEALEIANDNAWGLVGGVFASNIRRAIYFAERMECGIVNVNEGCTYWQPHTPFGGYSGKGSGQGRLGGKYTLLEMTQIKAIVIDIENVRRN